MMKFVIAGLLALSCGGVCIAQRQYKPTDQGSAIAFVIKNFGINTKGSFSGLDGSIGWDGQHPDSCVFDVSIDASTINTGNSMRDEHLKKEAYFDVANYPRIRFVSTGVTGPDRGGHYKVTGRLTIKNTTKDIAFPFIVTALGEDLIFKGDFTINRRDFGVGGSSTISNQLTVSLTVLAKKQ
ncbi:MAG TPA: YceI family protein [Puia sp.]|nr:YceI family protein [Puia sp.]